MIAVDTNLLVHAHRRDAELHFRAKKVLSELAEGVIPWGICLHSLVEFYGVVTTLRLWRVPSTPEEAFNQISAWRESPSLRLLCDDGTMLPLLGDLARAGSIRGAKIHDARIASCCLIHGVDELLTIDRDFSRFPRLKTSNPLIE
ncbi:MAG: TA system VapC family ribonuclease toxin [Polyangiaceae bacterium]|nr:TA system VapC family ribonuclease toxin [Polyangiaceae bacterium]